MTPYTILLVDDEVEMCLSLSELLLAEGHAALYTTDSLDAPRLLQEHSIDLLIMDIRMPGLGGIELLKTIKQQHRALPIIMITGYPTIEDVVCAMKYGAVNVYPKPIKFDDLVREIRELAAREERKRQAKPTGSHQIVTSDPAMQKILRTIEKVAPTPAPVLITGESGTGKEMVANSIHALSPRAAQPFVKVNCAALPEELLESELFGHERGAFTGAVKERKGRFELADKGTIFLDEIGDMSLRTQAKILRVIQEREFERVGGSKTLKADIRIIAATNKPLQKMIEEQTFRDDLYYRLSVVTMRLPPLRERQDDALLLAEYFIRHYNDVYQKQIYGMSDEVRRFFRSHQWPGNVRELKNCVERAIIFCERPVIDIDDLATQYTELIERASSSSYEEIFESLNREIILDALGRSGGVKQKAADMLNISRRTLYNRMKKLGI